MARERTRRGDSAPKTETPAFPGLAAIEAEVNKKKGEGFFAPASRIARATTHIGTGIFLVDLALHGGIPENAVTTLLGRPSSGKTTIATKIAAGYQAKYPDRAVIWWDAETTFDMDWAVKNGMVEDRTWIVRNPDAELAVDIVDSAMQTYEGGLIVVDSLPTIIPKALGEMSSQDKFYAIRAQIIGTLCSKIIYNISAAMQEKRTLTVLFINQYRDDIGATANTPAQKINAKKKEPCGQQPYYLATTKIEFTNYETDALSDDGEMKMITENKHGFRIKKNKTGNSLRQGEFIMVRDPSDPRGEGCIDDIVSVIAYSKRFGFWKGAGQKQYLEGVPGFEDIIFKKMADAEVWLRANPDHLNTLKATLLAYHRTKSGMPAIPVDGYLMGWHE